MRKILFIALAMLILLPIATAFIPPGLERAKSAIEKTKMPESVKQKVLDCLNTIEKKFTKEHTGDLFTYEVIPGVYENVIVKIGGYGSMLGQANATEWTNKSNQSTWWFNLTYYPRNVTLQLIGYSWWNNTNQHIVNNTGVVISDAAINETDGSWAITDSYSAVNPIWQSMDANLSVNTTASRVDHSPDTFAETVNLIYNITIDDGTFSSVTWNNVSFYVAPNTSLAATQDDLNVYFSQDATTWTLIKDGADGLTSAGTQWTGDVDLGVAPYYAAGNSTFYIKIEFVSDGANDLVGDLDIYFNDLSISGTVSKLPTRNPELKIDVNGDGTYDYTYNNTTGTTGLANGTAVSFNLGNFKLNLTNYMKAYAEGSQKVTVKYTWNDENRTALKKVQIYDKTYDVTTYFLAANETKSFNFTDVKTHGLLPFYVDLDEHSTNLKFNYTITADVYKWEGVCGGEFSVDPEMGVQMTSEAEKGEPIALFIRPENAPCLCNVTWFAPNATDVNATICNMTVTTEHGNIVHFVIGNITKATNVSVYVDNNLVLTVPVVNETAYFNYSNWSTHVLTVTVASVPGAPLVAPIKVTWVDIVIAVAVIVAFLLLVWVIIAAIRRK